MNKKYLQMTMTIPQPRSIHFAWPHGGLEHFFLLIDQHASWSRFLSLRHSCREKE